MRWSGPAIIVAAPCSHWNACSPARKVRCAWPLNSIVSHHVTSVRNMPVAALVLPPVAVLWLFLAWSFTFEGGHYLVLIAIWTVILAVVVEGFAVPIAVMALLRNGASRTMGNIVATIVGAVTLAFGIFVMVT